MNLIDFINSILFFEVFFGGLFSALIVSIMVVPFLDYRDHKQGKKRELKNRMDYLTKKIFNNQITDDELDEFFILKD